MNSPIITIITPSYNQGKYIERTIRSVLSQNISGLEYFIFDGGSTDETIDILKSFGDSIIWVSEKDYGQADAVNKGLKIAKGEIIGWLNSDDIYYPDSLNTAINFFNDNKDIDIIYGMADHIDENDNVIEPYYTQEWNYELLKDVCFICQPAVFFRRKVVDKYGFLDTQLRYCMDYEYWLRIGKDKPFCYIQKKLAGSRLYPETKTLGSRVAVHLEIIEMFKNKFGSVSSKWIYNYAHAVLEKENLKKEIPEQNMRFVKQLIWFSIGCFLRYKYYIPLNDVKLMAGWYVGAIKKLRE